ncbi:GHKL domain protein [Leptospira broomii serovar Hurstbridge str. 5399]|uniref:histidine kinase n=1 Tax=Leptospira broomii serovar Hurstbridge str. 5399 TaxID=1049789 RepID=T0F7C3_9LEPT|nr:ATP-binding protein [Leptospira broomii]EQA43412.1 GHKL domain protein [Leptospira broomii serovar Hurstbridge str. 5399]
MNTVEQKDSDNIVSLQTLTTIIHASGFAISDILCREISNLGQIRLISTSSIGEVIEKCINFPPQIILLDLDLIRPDLNSNLKLLRRLCSDALVILIVSNNQSISELSHIDWIWSYIKRDTLQENLKDRILEALQFIKENSERIQLGSRRSENLSSELEWLIWKESLSGITELELGKGILTSLTRSMFQGLGIGSLVGQLDLCEFFMREEDGFIRIPEKLFSVVLNTKNLLRNRIEKIEYFKTYLDRSIEKQTMKSSDLKAYIEEIIRTLGPLLEIKNQSIVIMNEFESVDLICNRDFLHFSINEILVNAMKFSPDNSEIVVSFVRSEDTCSLLFKNDVSSFLEGGSGIPDEYYYKVFEPFFRLNNLYDERFYSNELGMGIGLNVVRNLAKQIDCRTYLYEIKKANTEDKTRRVAIELKFKLASLKKEQNSLRIYDDGKIRKTHSPF